MKAVSASIFAVGCALMPLATPAQAAPQYTIVDLGSLGDPFGTSVGWGINDGGMVVGSSSGPQPKPVPALFSGGTVQSLGGLGGIAGAGLVDEAVDVNDTGQIVGTATNSDGNRRAFLYSAGVMTELGTLGGPQSWGSAINNAGQVAGRSFAASGALRAFLYDGGVMQDLGTLSGSGTSSAQGINSHGHVVGFSGGNAFLYSDGSMSNLGLGVAYDINDDGLIVGADLNAVAQVYRDGAWHTLGTLGGRFSEAFAVNKHGQVVGYAQDAGGTPRAFVYDGAVMHDLTSLIDPASGWNHLSFAFGINSHGQIAGWGSNQHGGSRAFLLTPISATPTPEPSSIALLGAGLIGLVWWGRGRRGTSRAKSCN